MHWTTEWTNGPMHWTAEWANEPSGWVSGRCPWAEAAFDEDDGQEEEGKAGAAALDERRGPQSILFTASHVFGSLALDVRSN